MDIDSIPLGVDFVEYLESTLARTGRSSSDADGHSALQAQHGDCQVDSLG
jgi:hypothetical protein